MDDSTNPRARAIAALAEMFLDLAVGSDSLASMESGAIDLGHGCMAEALGLALELDYPGLLGRAVVGRARRARRIDRDNPAPHRRPSQVVFGHYLGNRLAGVVQLDYLALEVIGEMPGVLRVCHGVSPIDGPSRNCPEKYSQSKVLFRSGMIEQYGTGIPRIKRACDAAGVAFSYRQDVNATVIRFERPGAQFAVAEDDSATSEDRKNGIASDAANSVLPSDPNQFYRIPR